MNSTGVLPALAWTSAARAARVSAACAFRQEVGQVRERSAAQGRVGDRLGHALAFLEVGAGQRAGGQTLKAATRLLRWGLDRRNLLQGPHRVGRDQKLDCEELAVFVFSFDGRVPPALHDPAGHTARFVERDRVG